MYRLSNRSVKYGHAQSVPRHSSPFNSNSSRKSTRPLRPSPPRNPKPKLGFSRDFFHRVQDKVLHCKQSSEPPRRSQAAQPFVFNLEDLLLMEKDLGVLAESLARPDDCLFACAEWWQTVQRPTFDRLFSLYKNEKVKRHMKVCLALCSLLSGLVYSVLDKEQQLPEALVKSIAVNCHQAFLCFIEFVLERIPQSVTNPWATQLHSLVKNKRSVTEDSLVAFHHFNTMAATRLRKLVAASPQTKAKKAVFQTLQVLTRLPLSNLLSTLEPAFGLEQRPVATKEDPPSAPYLPEAMTKPLSLILDLEETLVHYVEGSPAYLLRPYTQEFLKGVADYYEVTIFATGLKTQVDWILNDLDTSHSVEHRLHKQHAIESGLAYVKDLSLVGRDPCKTIIVDNVAENFQFQPENGILIKSWFGNAKDNALKELLAVLIEIARSQVTDVRQALATLKTQQAQQSTNEVKLTL